VIFLHYSIFESIIKLEDLGYEPSDYGFWKGYLFLEEATAESIIKDLLIPTFTPTLATVLKTFSARGIDTVFDKFDDFNRLFVFLHLEPTYKNKVWVIIDGGNNEKKIIEDFKKMYVKDDGWDEKHFSQFQNHEFENYYPERFQEDVKKILSDKKNRQENKTKLVKEVLKWSRENKKEAEIAWEKSAKEVIDKLKEIEKQLVNA